MFGDVASAVYDELTLFNVALILASLYLVRLIVTPAPDMTKAPTASSSAPTQRREPPAPRDFVLSELRTFDGRTPQTPVYMAVAGKVFDVSAGRHFYGPGGPYSSFAGRDASRGLAKMDVNATDADRYDDLSDLTRAEREILGDWEAKLGAKYPLMGYLRPPTSAPAQGATSGDGEEDSRQKQD
eukprot:Opistho-2@86425